MTLEYSIFRPSIPSYLKYEAVRDAIASGMEYVNKATSDRVKFSLVPHSEFSKKHVVVFGFEDYGPDDDAIGNWELNNGRYSVSFNSRYKWRTSWRQFWRPYSIHSTTIHEVGHLLGLPHSDDKGSVMHQDPVFDKFTSNDLAAMVYRINKGEIRWPIRPH